MKYGIFFTICTHFLWLVLFSPPLHRILWHGTKTEQRTGRVLPERGVRVEIK